MSNRTCLHCSRDISELHGNNKYCSPKCRDAKKWGERPRIPCSSCGSPTGWPVGRQETAGGEVRCKRCTWSSCGTVGAYQRHTRRGEVPCGPCRDAKAAAMRDYYSRRKAAGLPMGKGRPRYKNFQGTCRHCGETFHAEAEQPFCSRDCFGASKRRVRSTELVHIGPAPEPVAPPTPVTVVALPKWWGVITSGPCAWCGETFTAMSGAARYCSRRCQRQATEFRRGDRFMVEPRLRYAIYQRDDWTCQLCFEAVDRDADPWSDWYPSLDHVVPQSHGGSDEWDNLRLAHRWCNAVRGDGRWHSDFFKVVTEGGALRVRPDGRSTEDLARSA